MVGEEIAEARLHADAGMTGWVFARRTPPHAYGRWGTSPRTSGLTRLRGGRLRRA